MDVRIDVVNGVNVETLKVSANRVDVGNDRTTAVIPVYWRLASAGFHPNQIPCP